MYKCTNNVQCTANKSLKRKFLLSSDGEQSYAIHTHIHTRYTVKKKKARRSRYTEPNIPLCHIIRKQKGKERERPRARHGSTDCTHVLL